MRSLSQIIRMASTNEFSNEYEFDLAISDIRTVCLEDGFEFKEIPYKITHGDAIPRRSGFPTSTSRLAPAPCARVGRSFNFRISFCWGSCRLALDDLHLISRRVTHTR